MNITMKKIKKILRVVTLTSSILAIVYEVMENVFNVKIDDLKKPNEENDIIPFLLTILTIALFITFFKISRKAAKRPIKKKSNNIEVVFQNQDYDSEICGFWLPLSIDKKEEWYELKFTFEKKENFEKEIKSITYCVKLAQTFFDEYSAQEFKYFIEHICKGFILSETEVVSNIHYFSKKNKTSTKWLEKSMNSETEALTKPYVLSFYKF